MAVESDPAACEQGPEQRPAKPIPPIQYRWKKGQSGNPSGSSKRRRFSERLAEILEADDDELLKEIVLETVHDLRSSPKARQKLLDAVLNRYEGKVKDEIEHSGSLASKVVLLREQPSADPDALTDGTGSGATVPSTSVGSSTTREGDSEPRTESSQEAK